MLLNLTLKNFKRHRDLTVDFTSGIQCVKGTNEAGKSSCLHAIAYALFGSKALNLPLDEVVTWGEPVGSLKVELTLSTQGETYTFLRGKSGAEVIKGGKVFCTGQTEVSHFAAALLGADLATASKLLMANQNSIRGALEEGPKALSVMIETLSGMEVFDQILEAAQEKLALGSPALLEERLKGAEATLEAATQNLPPKPDTVTHAKTLKEIEDKVAALTATLPELKAKADATSKVWFDVVTQYSKRSPLERAVEDAHAKRVDAKAQIALYAPAAAKEIDTDRVASLKAQIANGEDFEKRLIACRVFRNLPPVLRYPGTKEAFELAIDEITARIKAVTLGIAATEKAITAANYRRINHDKCDKCGQDITHLASVKETNAAVDAELSVLIPKLKEQQEDLAALENTERELNLYRKSERDIAPSLVKLQGYCAIDDTTYPATVTWVGDTPGEAAPDVAGLKEELTRVEAEVKALEQAKTKLEMAQGMVDKAEAEVMAAEKALAELVCPSASDVTRVQEDRDYAEGLFKSTESTIYSTTLEAHQMKMDFDNASRLWGMAQARIDDAEKVIAGCKKDMGSLAFNNALVKKLRAIRPLVADKLWNTILSSVSVMFSQIRGEESWVSKGKDGFRVNGQAVESLSGSTLDALGLALRVSLMKTFLPQANLLILDEAAAGMDKDRTERMLGFLAGAQIGQVLLVTHEDISESVADNIITL